MKMKTCHSEPMKEHKTAICIATTITIIWAVGGGLSYWLLTGGKERASLGDMFGGVNSLFSALAFGGLIYTVLLQMQELALQRRELEMTREELRRTASAQEAASKALGEQIELMAKAARINGLAALLQGKSDALQSLMAFRMSGSAQVSFQGEYNIAAQERSTVERALNEALNDLKFRSTH